MLDELSILSIVKGEIAQGYSSLSGETYSEISEALKYYNGEPLGTEEAGHSKVISRDVKDVIEAVLPSLMRIFTSTDRAVEFLPFGPDDDEAAKQETDIVNYTFYKENDGFHILYTWFKDALLSKNGIVKVYWDEKEESVREEYHNIDDLGLQQLLNEDVEPIEHTEKFEDGKLLHDIVIRRTNKTGKPVIDVVPIEEFIISKDACSIFPSEARFTCHKTTKTVSDLIAEGFDKNIIESIGTASEDTDTDEVAISRDNKDDDSFGEDAKDPALREIEVFECYMRMDVDEDGIAELRQITVAGNEILVNEEIDDYPFIAITPIILTHKFFGFSLADDSMDIQLIKSTLLRGILDNMYLANNPRKYYQSGMVNLDDLLTSRAGGVVETIGRPVDVVVPETHTPLPPQVFETLDRMDQMRQERTGVGQEFFGLEGNVLAHGRTGVVNQAFDAAKMKLELIARIFAEVGVKQLFIKVHGLLQKYQDKEKVIRLRGKWVPVNPREWVTRENMTVNVGLGTGNKDKEIQNLMNILGIQKELLPTGRGITEKNVYDTLEKLVEASGFKDVSVFFTDPTTQPPPDTGPSFEEQLLQLQQQIEAQKAQTDQVNAETKRMSEQMKFMLERMKIEQKDKEIDLKDEVERTKIEIDAGRNVPGSAV